MSEAFDAIACASRWSIDFDVSVSGGIGIMHFIMKHVKRWNSWGESNTAAVPVTFGLAVNREQSAMDPKAVLWRKPDGNWGPVERLPDLQLAHKPTIQTESYGEDLSKFQFADDTLRTARSRFRRALRANNYNQFNTL
jgi:hypothetical protein